MIPLFYIVENTVKKSKQWLPAFSPFPTMFFKAVFVRVAQSRHCVVKGEIVW